MDVSSNLWLLIASASLAINFYPGPNNMFALANAARYGLAESQRASLGRHVVFGALVLLLALGLARLIVANPDVFRILKLAGAAFLIWLAIKIWRATPRMPSGDGRVDGEVRRRLFRDELLVSFANPKPIIVLLPFLPQIVGGGSPTDGATVNVALLAAGGLFMVLEALAALAYGLTGVRLKGLGSRPEGLVWLNRAGGAAVFAAAVIIASSG